MNFMEEQQTHLFELQLDNQAIAHLGETAKWARFLAIIGFIFIGLIVILAFTAGSFFAQMGSYSGTPLAAISGGIFTVVYLIGAAVWFFPNLFLFQFATRLKKAIATNDQTILANSFSAQKTMYKYMGILVIIYLAIIALALVLGILGTAMRA